MTLAEELTAAADRLDELVRAATGGPWFAADEAVWPAPYSGSPSDESLAEVLSPGSTNREGDAAYIAAMNPLNGRDLAVLLRVSAEALQACLPNEQGEVMADKPGYVPHPLLRIARRINGGGE